MCWAANWTVATVAKPTVDGGGSSGGRGGGGLDVRVNFVAGDAVDTCDSICSLVCGKETVARDSGASRREDEARFVQLILLLSRTVSERSKGGRRGKSFFFAILCCLQARARSPAHRASYEREREKTIPSPTRVVYRIVP